MSATSVLFGSVMPKCPPAAMLVPLDDFLEDLPLAGRMASGKVPSRRHLVPGSSPVYHQPAPHAQMAPINAEVLDTHMLGDPSDQAESVSSALSYSSVSPSIFTKHVSVPPVARPVGAPVSEADWSSQPSPQFFKHGLNQADQIQFLMDLSPASFVRSADRSLGGQASSDELSEDSLDDVAVDFASMDFVQEAIPVMASAFETSLPLVEKKSAEGSRKILSSEHVSLASSATAAPFTPSWVRDETPLPWAPAVLLGVLLALRDCALWSWFSIRSLRHPSSAQMGRGFFALTFPLFLAGLVYAVTSFRPPVDRLVLAATTMLLAPVLGGMIWTGLSYGVQGSWNALMSLVDRGRQFVASADLD